MPLAEVTSTGISCQRPVCDALLCHAAPRSSLATLALPASRREEDEVAEVTRPHRQTSGIVLGNDYFSRYGQRALASSDDGPTAGVAIRIDGGHVNGLPSRQKLLL